MFGRKILLCRWGVWVGAFWRLAKCTEDGPLCDGSVISLEIAQNRKGRPISKKKNNEPNGKPRSKRASVHTWVFLVVKKAINLP